MDIKPIETEYSGYRFRSRLEARWAVYFDAMGIKWEYEKEGYNLGEEGYYLPDFWFPDAKLWGEVKGVQFNTLEFRKACRLKNVLMLEGSPEYRTYYVANPGWMADYLMINENLCEKTDEPLHHTEYYGYFPDEMEPLIKKKYGDILREGIYAARSARFEHGEKPHIKIKETKTVETPQKIEITKEQKTIPKITPTTRTHVIINNSLKTEIDILHIVTEEGYQISPPFMTKILHSRYPEKALEYLLNNVDETTFVIEPESVNLSQFGL